MSLEKTNEFLIAFNRLDSVLKEMYPADVPSKLGVTRYLEAMRAHEGRGRAAVGGWAEDYRRLRQLRHDRNAAVHDNRLADDLFDDDDIAYVTRFYDRVRQQCDPLARLHSTRVSKPARAANALWGLALLLAGIAVILLTLINRP